MNRIADYTVLDLEMTGLDPKKDCIIEIGACRIRGGREEAGFHCLVNPRRSLPAHITELTGITEDMLSEGRDADEAIEELLLFLGEDLLVGQNLRFDYSFLAQWAINHRRSLSMKACDTLRIARVLLPPEQPKRLESLCEWFGIERVHAHRALDDARETGLVFEKLQDLLAEGHMAEADVISLLTPKLLQYKAKRQTPATPHQLERLKAYMASHKIEEEVDWEHLTRSQASRLQDSFYARYGR